MNQFNCNRKNLIRLYPLFLMLGDFVINTDDYEIKKQINENDYWKNYLIEDKKTKNIYFAQISKASVEDQTNQKDFFTDIEMYSKISHPAITSLCGFNLLDFHQDLHPTYITEYIPNGSLDKMMEKVRSLNSPNELTDTKRYIILLGIALGMNYLHFDGIIHNNLQPSTVLLDSNYYPKIIYFNQTKPKSIYSAFKSIEIVDDDEINVYSTDVRSFSLIAYEVVTNETPPIEFSKLPNQDLLNFLKKCVSEKQREVPSFDEILQQIAYERFRRAFKHIDYLDVMNYLEMYKQSPESMKFVSYVIQYLMEASEKGDVEAIFSYGNLLDKSELVGINKEEANHYLKMAADKGHVNAMFVYGCHLINGDGVEKNDDEAVRYLKIAADKGHIESMFVYACQVEKNKEFEEASLYMKMAADKDHVSAMFIYGWMLEKGEGVKSDQREACKYYKASADEGYVDGMFNYACKLEKGEGCAINHEEACRYFKMAADKGDIDSMLRLGYKLDKGDGCAIDHEEACRYFKMAVDKGDPEGMFAYAFKLEKGEGVDSDLEEACNYYKRSADQGFLDSMMSYGFKLDQGKGVHLDKREANYYFKMAADNGCVVGMYTYGCRLEKGEGIDVNNEEANYYYKMAADNGHVESMFIFGCHLRKGQGIKTNNNIASHYFRMAADKEHVKGMFDYG